MKTSVSHSGFFIVVLLSIFLGLSGCEQKGSAEKAGGEIDQAVEKAGDKIEGAKEAIGDRSQKTREYLDDTAITAKIHAGVPGDPMLEVAQINVITTNRVITLSYD